jgi:hypothetical protein
MITWGFVCSYGDEVTLDENLPYPATFIRITGTPGNIVWQNALGVNQYLPAAVVDNLYPIGAKKILTSGTVNGVSRTTTATGITYLTSPIP